MAKMKIMSGVGLLAGLVLLVVLPSVHGDLDTVRENPGMKGLYSMTQSFLNDVQSYTLGDLIADYDIQTFDDLADIGTEWKEWGPELIGLAICVAVGAIFIIVMPIIGCCYCCCRTCCGGCCCGSCTSKEKQNTKPSMGWTMTCTGLALGTAVIIFSMTICAYVSTGLVQEELSGNMLKDVATSIRDTEDFAHGAADDIDELVLGNLKDLNEDIETSLVYLPDTIMEQIDNMTQAESSLNQLAEFTGSLPELKQALADMDSANLSTYEGTLDTEVTSFKGGPLDGLLDQCSLQECSDAKTDLTDLTVVQIASDLTDTQAAKVVIDQAITDDIDADVQTLIKNLDDVNQEIETEISSYVDQVLDEVDAAAEAVNDSVSDALQKFEDVDLEDIAGEVDDVNDLIEPYAPYYGYALYGLTTVILIVAVMWIIGAILGVVGGSSAKKHGANLLLAGVSLTFIFSWLFMLITLLTFVLGGGLDVVACRHLVGFDEDAEKIVEVARNSYLDDFNYNISVKEVLDNCEADQAVYTALKLDENGFNITELLDLDQYGIYDELEKLKNITFNFGTVDVITPELNQTVLLLDAALDSVEFDKNLHELDEPITEPEDLVQYKADLDNIVSILNSMGDPLATDIQTEADRLQAVIDTSYTDVSTERNSIKTATEEGQAIAAVSLSDILENLNNAQTSLNNDLDGLISDILSKTIDDLIITIEKFIAAMDKGIRNDLVKCRQVFDILQTLIYAPCVYFLYPFNALWFCYGACLFFSIPGIIFATKTVGYFRRMNRYTKVAPPTAAIVDYDMELDQLGPPPAYGEVPSSPVPSAVYKTNKMSSAGVYGNTNKVAPL